MPTETHPTSVCPDRSVLTAFATGELPPTQVEGVSAHLTACPPCEATLLDILRATQTAPAEAGLTRTHVPAGTEDAATRAFDPAAVLPDADDPPAFGRFRLVGRPAGGGMGLVYRALDTRLKRVVAIKRLSFPYLIDPDARARFDRECQAIARLDHPNVVRVYEAGVVGHEPYLAMEYVPGGSLGRRVRTGLLAGPEAAATAEALARAVHYAHENGVLHRDLKPGNVLLAADGTPKVSDFGLAKFLDADGPTRSGAVMGTPSYMAPEQARGDAAAVDRQTDVYGLGAILYELLTGRPPFLGGSSEEIRAKVVSVAPDPPRAVRPGVDPHLEAVCLKCLEKGPKDRYPTAEALADDLARWRRTGYATARPVGRLRRAARWARRRPVLVGVVLLALAAGAAAPFIAAAADPDRAAKAAAADVGAGKRVVLVDPAGRPQVRPKVIHGSAVVGVPPGTPAAADPGPVDPPLAAGQPMQIRGTGVGARVELLPAVPAPAYRVTAEFQQTRGELRGESGLYFAATPVAGDGGAYACYYLLTFADVRAVELRRPGRASLVIGCQRLGVDGGDRSEEIRTPAYPAGVKWRRMVVDVTPGELRYSFDGVEVRPVNVLDCHAIADRMVVQGLQSTAIRPAVGGGLGVFTQSTDVQVRDVVVEPLPAP